MSSLPKYSMIEAILKEIYQEYDRIIKKMSAIEQRFLLFAEVKSTNFKNDKSRLQELDKGVKEITAEFHKTKQEQIRELEEGSLDNFKETFKVKILNYYKEAQLARFEAECREAKSFRKQSASSLDNYFDQLKDGFLKNVDISVTELFDRTILDKKTLNEIKEIIETTIEERILAFQQARNRRDKEEIEGINKRLKNELEILLNSDDGKSFILENNSFCNDFNAVYNSKLPNKNNYGYRKKWDTIKGVLPPNTFSSFEYAPCALGILPFSNTLTDVPFDVPLLIPFLNEGQIIVKYKKNKEQKATALVCSILGRLFLSNSPGKIILNYIDSQNAGIGLGEFRDLDRQIYTLLSETNETDELLRSLKGHINRNANLISADSNIGHHNLEQQEKEAPTEPYIVNVLSGYHPKELNQSFQYIFRLGAKCGVNFIWLLEDEEYESLQKQYSLFFEENAVIIHLSEEKSYITSKFSFLDTRAFEPDQLSDPETIQKIVSFVNHNKKTSGGALFFEKYVAKAYQSKETWFIDTNTSPSVNAPIGEDQNGKKKHFEVFTNGENARLVHTLIAGNTGTGKSVMLHAIITSLSLKYNPENLNFYLIDLKEGTEFQKYEGKLPHVKLIAKKTDVEYVYYFLKAMNEEISRRSKLFKANDVKVENIESYCDKTKVSLPRIIIIIDEYQRLFETRGYRERIENLLTSLLKQGRSFGINLIFATQNPGDTNSNMSLGQIAIRIALPSSPDTIRSLFEGSNKLASYLKYAGDAIYNTNYGNDGIGNDLFKGYFLEKNYHESLLNETRKLADERGLAIEQTIFDGNKSPLISENTTLTSQNRAEVPDKITIWMGASMIYRQNQIQEHLHFSLKPEDENNILVCGGISLEAKQNLLNVLLLNLINKVEYSKAAFRFFDYTDYNLLESEDYFTQKDFARVLSNSFDTKVIGSSKDEVEQELELIVNHISMRDDDKSIPRYPIFVCLYNVDRCKAFLNAERYSSMSKNLTEIIERGPSFGVYTIIYSNEVRTLKKGLQSIFENSEIFSYLGNTISLYMDENSSNTILGYGVDCKKLIDDTEFDENKAILYERQVDKVHFFNSYATDSIQKWLKNLKLEGQECSFKLQLPEVEINRKDASQQEEQVSKQKKVRKTNKEKRTETSITISEVIVENKDNMGSDSYEMKSSPKEILSKKAEYQKFFKN